MEWEAFEALEPFGGPIEDYRAGLAPMVMINRRLVGGDKAKLVSALDFYPHHNPDLLAAPEKLTPEKVAAQLEAHIFGPLMKKTGEEGG